MSTRDEGLPQHRDSSTAGESGAQVAPDQDERTDPADSGWDSGQVVRDPESTEATEATEPTEAAHAVHRRGWSGSEVARDQNQEAEDVRTGWSGSEVARDQDQEQADTRTGWSGSEVVHDQDQEPADEETGWNPDQIVTDLGGGAKP
jgi:hypothetical protein